MTPLYVSAQNDNLDVLRVLEGAGAVVDTPSNAGFTALHVACEEGLWGVVRDLLAAHADVNAVSGWHEGGYTPLCLASQQNHKAVVRELLRAGAHVNENNGTALHVASQGGHSRLVRTLLRAGAD
ncbi:ankyrin repeat protein, partial [Baffinella frigidus]